VTASLLRGAAVPFEAARRVSILPQCDHIDLQETLGCGVLPRRGDPGPALPS